MNVILCFGDSLTFGEKDFEGGGWVERLRKHFLKVEQSLPYQNTLIYNLGIASETTDGLITRLESDIRARRIGKQNLVVVLSYGLNDIRIHKNKNIVPAAFFKRNILKALEVIGSLNGKVIVVSMPPLNKEIDGVKDVQGNIRHSRDVSDYNDLLREIAEGNQSLYIDVHSILKQHKDIYAMDKVHLNSLGHRRIYDVLVECLGNQKS